MSGTGYTGKLFEGEVLATCLFQWNGTMEYIPFKKSMRLVMMCQPWNPADPSTRAGNDLHCQVAMALGLEDWDELRFYSALGSPLDRLHGIDGFFEWKGHVVTIDLTCDHGKEVYKADVIVRPEDFDDQGQWVAQEIARQFYKQGALIA